MGGEKIIINAIYYCEQKINKAIFCDCIVCMVCDGHVRKLTWAMCQWGGDRST